MFSKKNKNDNSTKFFSDASKYIPIVCHYDENTLLTKNGNLMQTILIHSIDQDDVSPQLKNVREILRNALKDHIDKNISFWVYTVRKKVDLSDNINYSSIMNAAVHELWRRKNYWHDKYVNLLYITFVYKAPDISLNKINSLLSLILTKRFLAKYDKELENANAALNEYVNSFLADISILYPERLKIVAKDGGFYSQSLSLIHYLTSMRIQNDISISQSDLSEEIGDYLYAFGPSEVEVLQEYHSRFAVILALKNPTEVPKSTLDTIMHLPIEFIITEVIHFVEKKDVPEFNVKQKEIFGFTKDDILQRAQLLNEKNVNFVSDELVLCKRQISFLIINSDLKKLNSDVSHLSNKISATGLAHVREDINLENAYWSLIPGNFIFLRRMNLATTNEVFMMSSIHNFAIGHKFNIWGKANTILREKKATPYFFNFHDANGNGNTFIVGGFGTGKTFLLNFLLAQSMKYNPKILYLTQQSSSEIFINMQYGEWHNNMFDLEIFDLKYAMADKEIFIWLMEIILSANVTPLTDLENQTLDKLYEFAMQTNAQTLVDLLSFDFPVTDENYDDIDLQSLKMEDALNKSAALQAKSSMLSQNNPVSKEDGLSKSQHNKCLEAKLRRFIENPLRQSVVNNGKLNITNEVTAINFESAGNHYITKPDDPQDKAALLEYSHVTRDRNIVREVYTYFYILKFLESNDNRPKIIALENVRLLLSGKTKDPIFFKLIEIAKSKNAIFIITINILNTNHFLLNRMFDLMDEHFGTKIYLPTESEEKRLQTLLKLSDSEFAEFSTILPSSRLFLLKQDKICNTAELSLGGFPAILRSLSSDKRALERFYQLREKHNDMDTVFEQLYDSFVMELESE